MMHPPIQALVDPLRQLCSFGGVAAEEDMAVWLAKAGIATRLEGRPEWAVPCRSFVSCALPAASDRDLCRKAALRVPAYRLHLDLILTRVIHAIGQGERWPRFEHLVFENLNPIMPRVYSLLTWASVRIGKEAKAIQSSDWEELECELMTSSAQVFGDWDEFLWGRTGRDSELFPLLEKLYLPIVAGTNALPIYCISPDGSNGLEMRLAEAAREGDALHLSPEEVTDCNRLIEEGLPVALREKERVAWLSGNLCVCVDALTPPEKIAHCEAPDGISKLARLSRVVAQQHESDLIFMGPGAEPVLKGTFVSVSEGTSGWPEELTERAPAWGSLPVRDQVREIGRSRRDSQQVDDAIRLIAAHPLYGVLLQVLLTEALDRELGQTTLLIAPPLDRKSECIEGETSIYYKPTVSDSNLSQDSVFGMVRLGLIDAVIEKLAQSLGYLIVPSPWALGCPGLWSFGLKQFISIGFVMGLEDRWVITAALHDRLYSGGLMKIVLRGRQEQREQIHKQLTAMWERAGGLSEMKKGVAV